MKELFENLLAQLKLAQSPLVDLLQDGISREEISKEIEKHNLKFSDALLELYSWKNGVKSTDQRSWKLVELFLLSFGIFRPLNISLETYENVKIKVWPEFMFPVFQSGAGETYLINCDNKSAADFVYYFAPADWRFTDLITIYDSFQAMIHSIAECYRQKAYYYNPGNYKLQIDDDKELEICTQINPKSDYWAL